MQYVPQKNFLVQMGNEGLFFCGVFSQKSLLHSIDHFPVWLQTKLNYHHLFMRKHKRSLRKHKLTVRKHILIPHLPCWILKGRRFGFGK